MATCDWREVRKQLGLPGASGPRTGLQTQNEEQYYYRNQEGRVLFRKVRWPSKNPGERKGTKLERYENGDWKTGLSGLRDRPLYNLPDVLEAKAKGETIAITEGERDADNVRRVLGIVATTNFDGAGNGKWKPEYSEALRGADVVIFYDQDEVGRAHKDQATASLRGKAKSIRVVPLPEQFNGRRIKDVTEYIEAGGTSESLRAIVDAAKEVSSVTPQSANKLVILDAGELLDKDPEPVDPIIKGLFDTGDKVALIAPSKQYKSFIVMQIGACVASGKPFLGFEIPKRRRVLLIQFEVKGAHNHRRLICSCRALNIQSGELRDSLFVVNGRGVKFEIDDVIQSAVSCKPELIILDPLYKLHEGDENSAQDVKKILGAIDTIVEKTGAAVLIVHHDKKGTAGDHDIRDRGAGSGVLARDYDCGITISPHKDDEAVRVIEFLPRNYPPVAPITAQWADGCFTLSNALPTKETTRNRGRRNRATLEELATKAVDTLRNKGQMPVTRFQGELGRIGFSKEQTREARDHLFHTRRIREWNTKGTRSSVKMIALSEEYATGQLSVNGAHGESF